MVGGCGWVGGIPSDYLVSTQLQLWLFCCWGCGCCWAVTTNELSEITAADKVEDASDKGEEHDANKVSDGVKDTMDDMKTKTGMVYYAFVPPPVR